MRRALITGITGQDGSYLAELLLAKGYEVHGLIRLATYIKAGSIGHLWEDPKIRNQRLFLHYGDLTDGRTLSQLLRKIKPTEVYNLASQSHVKMSFEMPEYTGDITGLGTVRLLESIREAGIDTRFYQAASSEMFGLAREIPQTERTPFHPRNPYACAKVYAYWTTVFAREVYGLHASNGILYNHESPRRGELFVTRKITRAVARILAGTQQELVLGNLDARRDWGYAKDYVEAIWRMVQAPQGDDYIIATGESHSVREFAELAFGCVGLDWSKHVKTDASLYRPTEVDSLVGDYGKAREKLGWRPTVTFPELVQMMVREDLRLEGLDPDRLMRCDTSAIA